MNTVFCFKAFVRFSLVDTGWIVAAGYCEKIESIEPPNQTTAANNYCITIDKE